MQIQLIGLYHMYTISDGWLDQATKIISPNFNQRPVSQHINAIIIHSISLPPGCYGGNEINQFFANELDCAQHPYFKQLLDLKVSAHFLIRRSGELIQYVSVFSRAWHAGQSCLSGQQNCNDYSIGIELEGTDTDVFAVEQYSVLIKLVQVLKNHFPQINTERIVGHSDIAPGRKTDPGTGFNWPDWQKEIEAL